MFEETSRKRRGSSKNLLRGDPMVEEASRGRRESSRNCPCHHLAGTCVAIAKTCVSHTTDANLNIKIAFRQTVSLKILNDMMSGKRVKGIAFERDTRNTCVNAQRSK